MKRPTFHITTSDGRTVFPDIEIVEQSSTLHDGVVPNDVRVNGVSMAHTLDPIPVHVDPEGLTTVTLTLIVNSVTIKQEEAA